MRLRQMLSGPAPADAYKFQLIFDGSTRCLTPAPRLLSWPEPMPETELFDPVSTTWSVLPPEPAPTSPDFSPRMGVLLSDGTVLTWSSRHFLEEPIPPFNGPGGLRTAKRLHPPGP